jgi:hypothetical protein
LQGLDCKRITSSSCSSRCSSSFPFIYVALVLLFHSSTHTTQNIHIFFKNLNISKKAKRPQKPQIKTQNKKQKREGKKKVTKASNKATQNRKNFKRKKEKRKPQKPQIKTQNQKKKKKRKKKSYKDLKQSYTKQKIK